MKTKKRYVCVSGVQKETFFATQLFLFNEESKKLVEKHGKAFAKNVDEILSKVRLNSPKTNLSENEKNFFYKTLNQKPVFLFKNNTRLKQVQAALEIEDFFAICLVDDVKNKLELFEGRVNFVNKKSKFVSSLKNLNINFPLPNNFKINFNPEQFSFNEELTKSCILTKSYLLEKYQNKKIDFFVYRFFVGECISVVVIKNKQNTDRSFSFEYFFDLADKKINYYNFEIKNNFVMIKDQKDSNLTYFNFSDMPNNLKTSALVPSKKSNLPCLHLKYDVLLRQSSSLNLSFMFSKNAQPLPLLNFKKLVEESSRKLDEMFCLEIDFLNSSENKFFQNIVQKAKISLLQSSKTFFSWQKENYVFLKEKYINKEIDALCFYLSVKHSIASFFDAEVGINPHFISQDFSVSVGNEYKPIYVFKNKTKVPYLVLQNVKYYNHFNISLSFLKSSSAKIQA